MAHFIKLYCLFVSYCVALELNTRTFYMHRAIRYEGALATMNEVTSAVQCAIDCYSNQECVGANFKAGRCYALAAKNETAVEDPLSIYIGR